MSEFDYIANARRVVGPGPDVAGVVAGTPRVVPPQVRALGLGAIAFGLAAGTAGLFMDADRTKGVILTCIVYFFGIGFGGTLFSVIQTQTLGRWGRPFKRVAESFGTFLPIVYGLWLLFVLFGADVYPWRDMELPPHKAIYLSYPFWAARQVVGVGFLVVLSQVFIANSMRPDMGTAAETLGAKAPAWWGRFTGGWQGREAEIETAYQKNIRLGPVYIVSYAIIYSMFAVDAVMSLEPYWYANMFPLWQAVSSLWLSLNWVVIVSVLASGWLGIKHLQKPANFHDIGKFIFALSIFWAYTFFAQLLPIWYGNIIEETGYLILRIWTEPWSGLAKVVGAFCFLMPFTVLLSRGIKKMPSAMIGISCVVAIGVFLERFILVMPPIYHGDSLPIGLVEVGVFVGFIGGFATWVSWVLSQVPPVVFTDPFMNPHPDDVHLHAHGDHADHGGGGHDHGHAHA